MELTLRKQNILEAVIRLYISTGEPVGSNALRSSDDMNLSSATIRSEMSDLCDMGLLEQPHTSAGRVPTVLGYRLYIEKLMDKKVLSEEEKKSIDMVLPSESIDPNDLIDTVCDALAELTKCAAISTTPADHEAVVKRVQLLRLNRHTLMLILIASNGIIKNRVARSDGEFRTDLIIKLENIFKAHVYGQTLDDFTRLSAQKLTALCGQDALAAAPVIIAFIDAVDEARETELRLKGGSNLLGYRDLSTDRAKLILEYLGGVQPNPSIFTSPIKDITVFLGDETGENALESFGVIVSGYRLGDKEVGNIGIIGPDRMDYEMLIPRILYFSERLGRLLTDFFLDDDFPL